MTTEQILADTQKAFLECKAAFDKWNGLADEMYTPSYWKAWQACDKHWREKVDGLVKDVDAAKPKPRAIISTSWDEGCKATYESIKSLIRKHFGGGCMSEFNAEAMVRCDAMQVDIDTLRAENKRLREALERIASAETFTIPFMGALNSLEWKELKARMDYAKQALQGDI